MSSEYLPIKIAEFMGDYKALYESVRQLRCAITPKRDSWGMPTENKYQMRGIANNILTELIPRIPFEFWEHLDIDISALERECSEIVDTGLVEFNSVN